MFFSFNRNSLSILLDANDIISNKQKSRRKNSRCSRQLNKFSHSVSQAHKVILKEITSNRTNLASPKILIHKIHTIWILTHENQSSTHDEKKKKKTYQYKFNYFIYFFLIKMCKNWWHLLLYFPATVSVANSHFVWRLKITLNFFNLIDSASLNAQLSYLLLLELNSSEERNVKPNEKQYQTKDANTFINMNWKRTHTHSQPIRQFLFIISKTFLNADINITHISH